MVPRKERVTNSRLTLGRLGTSYYYNTILIGWLTRPVLKMSYSVSNPLKALCLPCQYHCDTSWRQEISGLRSHLGRLLMRVGLNDSHHMIASFRRETRT